MQRPKSDSTVVCLNHSVSRDYPAGLTYPEDQRVHNFVEFFRLPAVVLSVSFLDFIEPARSAGLWDCNWDSEPCTLVPLRAFLKGDSDA